MRKAIMPCYAPPDMVFERGQGSYLITEDGRRYLDFTAGIGVNSLGHANPLIIDALKIQAEKLWHTSNLFRIPCAEKLAQRLTQLSFADRVFLANSGAEANECGLKAIRRYHYSRGDTHKTRIIGMSGAFHGRTIATVAAGGTPNYCQGFIPTDYGFDHVPFGDIAAVEATITQATAGVILEPVQGEGGVKVADKTYLQQLRQLCDKHGILLMFDEVQCGVARSGQLYAYQALGVVPDILSSAKGLGAGFPIGACLMTEAVGKHMAIGTHGSTFGGNYLAATVANAVLDMVTKEDFLLSVSDKANYLMTQLAKLVKTYPAVYKKVTGLGLMIGMQVGINHQELLLSLREDYQTLVVKAGGNSLRFLPPLTVSLEEIDDFIATLSKAAQAHYVAITSA